MDSATKGLSNSAEVVSKGLLRDPRAPRGKDRRLEPQRTRRITEEPALVIRDSSHGITLQPADRMRYSAKDVDSANLPAIAPAQRAFSHPAADDDHHVV